MSQIPDYKTVESVIYDQAASRLSSLKSVDFFGVQLDHWTSASHRNVLVVFVSCVTECRKSIFKSWGSFGHEA